MAQKELIKTTYSFADKQHNTELVYDDGSKVYIYIQCGMIFVADCSYEELSQRIANDDIDSFESYDTSDGCSYYLASEYATDISDALLDLSHRMLQ